eukprot:TRINITY_DN6520_c0_g3_i4.p1 TRINITY_DN6520_c0_g3~~TRINITY_DN6520_c0_g3_i4.p1  ORF type:complete len:402 (+),score=78.17 TRINITY_DN6520_c0_g3_i4:173-1378(+)
MSQLRYRDAKGGASAVKESHCSAKQKQIGQAKYKSSSIESSRLKQLSPAAKKLSGGIPKKEPAATKDDVRVSEEKLKHLMTTKFLALNNEIEKKIVILAKSAFDSQMKNIREKVEEAHKKQSIERKATKRLLDEIVKKLIELSANPNSESFYFNTSPHLKDMPKLQEELSETAIMSNEKLKGEIDLIGKQCDHLRQENCKLIESIESIKESYVPHKDLYQKITAYFNSYKEAMMPFTKKQLDVSTFAKHQKESNERFISLEVKWKTLKDVQCKFAEENFQVKKIVMELMNKHSAEFNSGIKRILSKLSSMKHSNKTKLHTNRSSKRNCSQDNSTPFLSESSIGNLDEDEIRAANRPQVQSDRNSMQDFEEDKQLIQFIKEETAKFHTSNANNNSRLHSTRC